MLIDQKVMGSDPARSKGVFFWANILLGELCVSAGTKKHRSRAQPLPVKIWWFTFTLSTNEKKVKGHEWLTINRVVTI